jgi:hypothetical protein
MNEELENEDLQSGVNFHYVADIDTNSNKLQLFKLPNSPTL